ncbi:MAG: hypothetical protein methR_P3384 [Methyloprofundus sp.]|nr:MAG: hypothetical protein methR_P3384 [Methyloprofundus sp.]
MNKAYGASVYVSYARKDEQQFGTVAKLYQAFAADWVSLKVDEYVMQPRKSFKDFIAEIGKADCIIVIFSEAYFKSFYCMLELTRIMECGNVKDKKRVFSIFLDDVRLDDKQRQLKSHWETNYTNWKKPYDEVECDKTYAEEYGSEIECKAIVDNYDDIFSCFAFDQAYHLDNLYNEDFAETIQWSKQCYFNACASNPIFNEAIKHLLTCSDRVKTALEEQISDNSVGLTDAKIIACLVDGHPADLLQIIANVQGAQKSLADKQSLAKLLKLLLPLLFDPAYVSIFKAQRESANMVKIPYALPVTAEVLMASADSRELELYVKKAQTRGGFDESMPGKYHLGSPPESGENMTQTLANDMEQHLKNLTGDSNEPSTLLMQNHLFKAFVRTRPGKTYSNAVQQRRINSALAKAPAHYYWIMPFGKGDVWNNFAQEIQEHYPKIIVLQLEDENDAKEEAEDELFNTMHSAINY